MDKLTLMIFGHPSLRKKSKVSFQSLDTTLDDLESGLSKVAEAMESGTLKLGQVFPLWGYVHASKATEDDDDWELEISPLAPAETVISNTQVIEDLEEEDEIPF